MKTYNEFFSGYRMGKRLGKLARGVGSVAAPALQAGIAQAGKSIGSQVAKSVGPILSQQLAGATQALGNKLLPGAAITPGGPATGTTAGTPATPMKIVPKGTATAATAVPPAGAATTTIGAPVATAPATPGKSTSTKTITSPRKRTAAVGVAVPASGAAASTATTPGAASSAAPATTVSPATPAASSAAKSTVDFDNLIKQKETEMEALKAKGDDAGSLKAYKDLNDLIIRRDTDRRTSSINRRLAAQKINPNLINTSVDNKGKKVIKEFWPAVIAGAARLAPVVRAAAAAAGTGAASTAGGLAAQKAINKMEKPKTPGEECEGNSVSTAETGVLNIKGTPEELQKVLQILKSSGLLENKYNKKDMSNKKQINELSVSGGILGGVAGSLVGAPGMGALVGSSLPGAIGAMKRAVKGEEEENKKKKKKLDPVGKEDADVDNDGKKNTASDQYILKKRAAIANARAKVKAKESTDIRNFIKCISQKNYAEANKYLQEVVNSKIKERIAQSLKNK